MHPEHSVRYAATRNKRMMASNSQNIHAADHIAWGRLPTRPTVIEAPVLVPFPAYGTRLRGIGFVHLDRATGFIIQLGNQAGITRATDLLSLVASQVLCGIVKGLPHIARGAREG